MVRVLALLTALGAASVLVLLGLAVTIRVLFPQWYAVPGAILQMTSQQVPSSPDLRAESSLVVQEPAPPAQATPDVPPPAVAATNDATPQVTPQPTAAPVAAAAELAKPLQETTPGGPLLPNRRFNVLLLGSDNDLKFSANAVLTQAMILVSIDPAGPDVAMISIPRDFWVPIRGYGYQKIDVAYEVGGIALARSTVESLLGVKVDYYAWVGLNGLVQVIDTLGGVDVNVQHPILDEMYPDDLNSTDPYAFFRLYIPAGPQHLDGTTALEYVRSRHGDLMSDFGRSARQQQVLLAIKNRVQALSLLSRLPELVSDMQGSVKTDFSIPAVLQLAAMSRKVAASNIHQQVLSAPDYATLGYSPDGTEQVVFPDWSAIRPVIARLTRSNSASALNDTGT